MGVRRKQRRRRPPCEGVVRKLLRGDEFFGSDELPEVFTGQVGVIVLGHDADPALVRPLWEEHREEVLTEWIADWPSTRPCWWWAFDAPEARADGEDDADYLERVGELTDDERAYLALVKRN